MKQTLIIRGVREDGSTTTVGPFFDQNEAERECERLQRHDLRKTKYMLCEVVANLSR